MIGDDDVPAPPGSDGQVRDPETNRIGDIEPVYTTDYTTEAWATGCYASAANGNAGTTAPAGDGSSASAPR